MTQKPNVQDLLLTYCGSDGISTSFRFGGAIEFVRRRDATQLLSLYAARRYARMILTAARARVRSRPCGNRTNTKFSSMRQHLFTFPKRLPSGASVEVRVPSPPHDARIRKSCKPSPVADSHSHRSVVLWLSHFTSRTSFVRSFAHSFECCILLSNRTACRTSYSVQKQLLQRTLL